MRIKNCKCMSILLALALILGIFCVAPTTAAAAESDKASSTSIARSERQRGIPMPEGMILNDFHDSDPNRPEWDGLYKIYYFLAPDEWLDPAIAKYKNEGFEIGFYWFYGGSYEDNTAWPGDPANNLADYMITYYEYMNPSASEEDIAEYAANTEAVFGKVYFALCRSDANTIIWNNGIDGGLPTNDDYDPAKDEAAQQTQDVKVQDAIFNVLGSKVEIPDDIYDSDEFFSTGEYRGNYATGVTDLCGCITYVRDWKLYENPLTGITSKQAVTNWKFYNPISGDMTNKGFTDEDGELILNDLGEAQSPYFDMDYTYIPPEVMPPEPPDNTPHEPPIGSINLPHNSMPFFRGGTVYWECPWSTNVYGFAAYCHVYGSNGYWLYDWQTESEKMTAAPEKGENVFKYDIPAGPYDLIIFSISTGAQTYECVLTDDCIGKIAKTDKSNMLENPLDSNRIAASTEFEGVASSGPHLAITSIGNITGKLMCPTENGEHVVAAFIKTYLGFNDAITADMLADFIPIFDTTALDVYAVLAADSEFPTFLLSDGTKMLDKAAELLGINPLGEEGRPFFKGGTIYWECPWPTDGRIFKAYCHVYGSDGSWLYDWQDSSEEMTRAPEKGENVFKYYIPTGPYDLIIFSISTGAQTYACVLNNDCIGKIAKTDKNNMLENPVDSYKYAAATEFEGVASSGPHIEITSVGNVVGKVICPTEDGASIVAMFIKNYLAINLAVNPDKMTSDTLANLVNSFDTTALDVYNILAADNKFASFTLEDGTNQLDKAAELLGIGRDKGDVNGDGTIDAKDRMFITRHIAKWQGYESINEAAADVNADGLIDAKDRMVLTRHIAKWVGYETLPYVKGAA